MGINVASATIHVVVLLILLKLLLMLVERMGHHSLIHRVGRSPWAESKAGQS